jgi:hypothetical protein
MPFDALHEHANDYEHDYDYDYDYDYDHLFVNEVMPFLTKKILATIE